MPNGDYGAIEIKLGTDKIEEAAINLLKFNELVLKKPNLMFSGTKTEISC